MEEGGVGGRGEVGEGRVQRKAPNAGKWNRLDETTLTVRFGQVMPNDSFD